MSTTIRTLSPESQLTQPVTPRRGLFSHFRYVTRGEHDCEYCSHGLTAIALNDEGLKQRKAKGLTGRANFVWNFSIDRKTPARLGGAYQLKPKKNVVKVSYLPRTSRQRLDADARLLTRSFAHAELQGVS